MMEKRIIEVSEAVWVAAALLSYEKYVNNCNLKKEDIFFRQSDIVKRANELTEKEVRIPRTSVYCCADHPRHTHKYLRCDNKNGKLRRLTAPTEFTDNTYPKNISETYSFVLKDGLEISFGELLHFAQNEYAGVLGINKGRLDTLDNMHSYEEKMKHALSMNESDLREMAKRQSTKYPREITTTIIQKVRDPYVSEYAKRRAKGICQLCGHFAPFNRADGEPYLESHHIKWLSEGGADSIGNTVALCPNCHRRMHIINDKTDIEKLRKIIKKGDKDN